jgi:peptidoglycan L-alanyl-D-glutamate endopeptidase CwlK
MSYYRLSRRSLDNLEGVQPALEAIVKRAINLTRVDFGVIQGLRTMDQQKKLHAYGASRTMKSKHLSGHAVDLMAYIGSRGCWEINLYDDIADAMKQAAIEQGTPLRWGAAWNVADITEWMGTCESAMEYYIDTRRGQGRRPFIDAVHFELHPEPSTYYGA